jgi:predicted YcjX-like family ATPase
MVFTSVTDRLGNAAGSAVGAVSGRFSDRVIRLGVTGLSRAGKTVFITSLVANLLNLRAHAAALGGK